MTCYRIQRMFCGELKITQQTESCGNTVENDYNQIGSSSHRVTSIPFCPSLLKEWNH